MASSGRMPARNLLKNPANQFLAGGVVVVLGRELAAVGVFVVEPGIDRGKDGSLAVLRRGHQNVAAFA